MTKWTFVLAVLAAVGVTTNSARAGGPGCQTLVYEKKITVIEQVTATPQQAPCGSCGTPTTVAVDCGGCCERPGLFARCRAAHAERRAEKAAFRAERAAERAAAYRSRATCNTYVPVVYVVGTVPAPVQPSPQGQTVTPSGQQQDLTPVNPTPPPVPGKSGL